MNHAPTIVSTAQHRVAAVVLTYNSADDLPDCLYGLKAQRGIDLRVIVVDNASLPDARDAMAAQFVEIFPGGTLLDVAECPAPEASALFVRNNTNVGYSAGNNIGVRAAMAMGCNAILIVNPDVRIEDMQYVAQLAQLIVADPKTAVACSALTNLSGRQENPMTEPGFFEELLWPLKMLTAGLFRLRLADPTLPANTIRVSKVSGACFLIRMDFLRHIGFFDELVFLYCEESILHAQVRAAGWHMVMDPRLHALHAHRSNAKEDPLTRFQVWAESRRRFHMAYGGYGTIQQRMLAGSRLLSSALIRGRTIFKRLRSGLTNKTGEL